MCLPLFLFGFFLFSSQEKNFPADNKAGFGIQVNVTSSPFFNDIYKYGDITLNRGRRIPNVRIKIDLINNITQFISNNGIEVALDPGAAKEISYADTTSEGIVFYKFRTGFPAIEGKTADNFYRMLADGKCGLLQSIEKKVYERKRDTNGQIIKEYETYDYYYLFIKGVIKRLRREKEFILAELAEKEPELSKYIEENKLNMRNQDHINKLVNYYNTL